MAYRLTAALIGGLVLAGTGLAARADTPKVKPQVTAGFTARDAFAPDRNQWGPQGTQKSIEFDAKKGKWGLKLDLEQTTVRDMGWNDVGAGAYFKVTPSRRIGGGVSLNSANDELRAMAPQQRSPKVKLETAFRF